MARFRGTVQGQRGQASRLGNARTGLVVEANGWHAGIRVEVNADDTLERFEVYQTDGSAADAARRLVGILRFDPAGGATWEPK